MIKSNLMRHKNAFGNVTKKYSYHELKELCKKLGLTDSKIYRDNYKAYGLPAHPERIYNEWISYREFFDLPEFVSYKSLKKLIISKKFKNAKEYKQFIYDQNDPTLPADPQTVYPNEWENWYAFLGKTEPYKPEFIPKKYQAWREKIEEFMKVARGGGTKISALCRFVRQYIIPYDGATSPQAFLCQESFDLKPLKVVVEKFESSSMQKRFVNATNEFLDYVVINDLTFEDEETGEIVRVNNARNPIQLYAEQVSNTTSSVSRTETARPCLQYHFVKNVQKWIIPEKAKNFKDLKHLHIFDADWIKVPRKSIVFDDEDCVYRRVGSDYFIWVPTDWILTYALTKIPLRGRQIAYNDSGEADDYIADIDDNGKIIWIKNTSPFAGMTRNQSFISKMIDGQAGIFTTTNKTKNNGKGYTIPWIPEELAYWLVKLRKWQQRYNPIAKPTAWLECSRTSFNEIQLKEKGINCFLFRRFNDFEPANITNALTSRLAAALYYSQPKTLSLAELNGSPSSISAYNSVYTPHSMRVSLITAYVMKMGMPIEVVMKIVGHSSVVMSIYYCKISNKDIRKRLEEGEKLALKSEVESIQRTIEQQKIESVKNQLTGSNKELIEALDNSVPAGNFIFRDYGICPFAATKCDDGGETITNYLNAPAPPGYLGTQNCLRCRHFVTGPAFLGGLIAISNEILLQSNEQSDSCHKLQRKINKAQNKIEELERQEYIANAKGVEFMKSHERHHLEIDLRNLESQYETVAMKLDMFLCDLQACYAHIKRSQELINNKDSSSISLITSSEAEIKIEIEEVNHFQQLQEVCENATIYRSCSADNAIFPRTQILDKVTVFNDMMPRLFTLSKEQQLKAGNQIYQLLLSRLKTWDKILPVIDCKVKLIELEPTERIEPSEIDLILTENTKYIEHDV